MARARAISLIIRHKAATKERDEAGKKPIASEVTGTKKKKRES